MGGVTPSILTPEGLEIGSGMLFLEVDIWGMGGNVEGAH